MPLQKFYQFNNYLYWGADMAELGACLLAEKGWIFEIPPQEGRPTATGPPDGKTPEDQPEDPPDHHKNVVNNSKSLDVVTVEITIIYYVLMVGLQMF
jgi:hypothetical protein